MLNCSRSIDIHSRFGLPRIAFISFVTMVITFFISFEIFHFRQNATLTDKHFFLFLVLLFFLYPIHKAIHLLTVFPYFKHFRMHKLIRHSWLPFYNIYIDKPIHKIYFCICLIMPLCIITIAMALIARSFPEHGHYAMFLLALNAGYSVMDILYLKIIVFSRQGDYIEEHINGFMILDEK
ncbi:DUF3267 domain-containing protein [Staphylococcus chromogenes]|uniref:DUF3267 domain-containing protein n=1 Tax=Staphylococcus chromogenes TaxID=46126 RepID=UPI001404D70D|nr:DUF3267 domain-containing protein [Staphylococcus chromogenes]QIN26339.1 DUF3267 domain-containing protein [Staphylococcus chromogenes]